MDTREAARRWRSTWEDGGHAVTSMLSLASMRRHASTVRSPSGRQMRARSARGTICTPTSLPKKR